MKGTKQMKRITFNLIPIILLWFGSCCIVSGQTSMAQSDNIQSPSGEVMQADESPIGRFEPVPVAPTSSSNVALQFPASLAGTPVAIVALDGGTVNSSGDIPGIDGNGSLSFPFQVSDQPGVYRVAVISPNGGDDGTGVVVALLQLEVPAPAN